MSTETDSLTEEAKNALALAELIVDPDTTPALQVKVITTLLDGSRDTDFFHAMFEASMSLGECPCCGHLEHWLIPETNLNEMGYVTADHDPRVKKATTAKDCAEYQEACPKKKCNV